MGGNTCTKWQNNKKVTYTNANIVPYNPYLLFRYNCHINVEFINSINALKYHIKYIYKGQDQATYSVNGAELQQDRSTEAEQQQQAVEARDEVEEFKHARYVAGAEACHRIQRHELAAERVPAVLRLQVHLPGQQTVCFDANDKDGSIEKIERGECTQLTAFLSLTKQMNLHVHYYTENSQGTTHGKPQHASGRRGLKRAPTRTLVYQA